MLAWLWTRLSEGGPQVSISGRTLRRFSKHEVNRLLRARALIEQRQADSWSVCAHCDCGLDVRPIRTVDGELRACCPYDSTEDVILEADDLRRFRIDADRLAVLIASAIAQRMNGMIDKTAREAQAIRDARALFAEALTDLGLMEPFFHRTAADIDRLIEAAVTGYVDSMLAQGARKERTGTAHDDPIPF